MATTSPLRQRMIEDMTIRNLSPATQQSYIYAVRKFSRHFGASPDRLGIEDVRAYQLHLIAKKRSWSHINQAACALRFFFGVTMGQKDAFERIVNGREPEKLPPVLAPDEIARFLEAVVGLRNRVALTTAYAAGLRIGEVCRLKVTSIDGERKLIHVECGKGGKDRYAMLSPRLLDILRAYWRRARPGCGCFPAGRLAIMSSIAALQEAGRKTHDEAEQAHDGSQLAPQLRDAPSRERRRSPHHPGVARTFRPFVDHPLCAGRHSFDRQHAKSVRPAVARGDPARMSRGHAPEGAGGGGYFPPPRRRFSRCPRQPAVPRPAQGHGRDRGMPNAGVRRSCRALRGLRRDAPPRSRSSVSCLRFGLFFLRMNRLLRSGRTQS